ncbi:hypothetical protein [Cohnella mopanensis]|uniref:hypothetical protein n=1 Tax=Cohnella mopanensis TaxID=2911966 RepID=UPI001EF7A065|nr:hypothetical protein [Cohnella mopanensis]
MIKIASDGEAYWSESIDLGAMGKFDTVIIDLDGCEAAGASDDMSRAGMLEKAAVYYGARFKDLETNADRISEQFLMWIITHLCDIEYPFWQFDDNTVDIGEYPDYIVKEEIIKFEDESGRLNRDPHLSSPIYKQLREYDPYTNRDKLTSYEIVDKYLPVLDFKKLIVTINPDSLDTFEENVHFQVSSEVCGGMLLCATYGTIYDDNKLEVTNNC